MGKVFAQLTMTLDGFITGPDEDMENPLGKGGEHIHEWVIRQSAWRASHGLEGGDTGPDNDIVQESQANVGATIMGRRMFNFEPGPWQDPGPEGWWGDDPPFHTPVFVLTHYPRPDLVMKGGTTFHFVTDGLHAAFERARAVAGDKNISVAGGAQVVQECIREGLLDELTVHIAPVFIGGGRRLFENLGSTPMKLENTTTQGSPNVSHLTYRFQPQVAND